MMRRLFAYVRARVAALLGRCRSAILPASIPEDRQIDPYRQQGPGVVADHRTLFQAISYSCWAAVYGGQGTRDHALCSWDACRCVCHTRPSAPGLAFRRE